MVTARYSFFSDQVVVSVTTPYVFDFMLLLGFKKINMLHNTYCFICFCFLFWKLHLNNDFQQKLKRQWLFVRSAFNMSNVIIMASCYNLLHPLTFGRWSKDGCLTKPDGFLLFTSTFIVRLNRRSLCNVTQTASKGFKCFSLSLFQNGHDWQRTSATNFTVIVIFLGSTFVGSYLAVSFLHFYLYTLLAMTDPPPPSVSSDHHVIPSDYRPPPSPPPTLSAINSHFHIFNSSIFILCWRRLIPSPFPLNTTWSPQILCSPGDK